MSTHRIIICDDDAWPRSIVGRLLEEHDYTVRAVSSARHLLELTRAEKVDLILLDLFATDSSGWEVAAALRSSEETKSIPIVMLGNMPASEVELPAALVDGWVEKPVDPCALLEVVENVLQSRPQRSFHILVVEDEDLPATILKRLFEKNGVTFYRARNGVEAIDMASWVRPDLLVLDVRLPDIDGYSVIKWLRKHDVLRNTPVVIYSGAEISPADKQRLELGPTELIIKGRLPITAVEQQGMKLLAKVPRTIVAAADLTVN